jgi:hypothetical protein
MTPKSLHGTAVRPGLITLLAIVIAACLSGTEAGAKPRVLQPLFSTLAVAGLTIEPQTVDRFPKPALNEDSAQILAEGATRQAERSLLRFRIAASVVREKPGAQPLPRLAGVVRMPVSLPSGLHGLKAARQKGDLATATVEILDAEGRILATGTAAVAWNDVRWLRGGPRYRRSRPVYEVLAEAARKSVDLAVEHVSVGYK